MSNFLTPAAAYLNRRNELLAGRSVVQSPAVIQTINKALLASEIAMATFYDLESLRSLQQRKARLIDWHDPKRQRELLDFELRCNELTLMDETDEAAFDAYQLAFSQFAADYPWQHASIEMVQNELFSTTFTLWQETLEELFAADHRQHLFIRIDKILTFSIGKIPVLGETRDVWRALKTVIASCRQRAPEDEACFTSLESYSEAANLCSRGILLFCFTTEAVLRGQALPDETQLNEKIKDHFDSVIDGTHPWF
ncbi:hypothetical protein [Pantoea sp. BAV 3049]|uniref:hypothetical protein n=1 Tax=Pantoea sp. BAV 3049 TaxID=2654188 RepID=UPI00131BACFD|nr:hypothetical protein [Pantoea sp. BAV 3049]